MLHEEERCTGQSRSPTFLVHMTCRDLTSAACRAASMARVDHRQMTMRWK
jgi:hypothetical protein